MTIKLLIADDHGVIRAGLRALLNDFPEVKVIGDASNGKEALEIVAAQTPDLVLMDVSMPEMGGIEATKEIKARYPDVRVLMLSVHEDDELLREAIRSGASGYIVKRATETELYNAIQAVCRDEIYVHPSMTRALLQHLSPEPSIPKAGLEKLTRREVDVLYLLARGYTNQQIANQLHISVRTVEGHRSNLSGKLGLRSRVELVNFAEEYGLLDLGSMEAQT